MQVSIPACLSPIPAQHSSGLASPSLGHPMALRAWQGAHTWLPSLLSPVALLLLTLPLVVPKPWFSTSKVGTLHWSLEDPINGLLFSQLLTPRPPCLSCFSSRWQVRTRVGGSTWPQVRKGAGGRRGKELIFADFKSCLFHLAQLWSAAEHLLPPPYTPPRAPLPSASC